MASDYKCDICGAAATVHITKIVGGKKIKVHLCENCAKKASFDSFNLPPDLFPKIKKFEQSLIESVAHMDDGKFCKVCGCDLEQLANGGRFSCPDCYASMGDEKLFELFSQLHAATRHVGKCPKKHKTGPYNDSPEGGKSANSGMDRVFGDGEIPDFADALAGTADDCEVPGQVSGVFDASSVGQGKSCSDIPLEKRPPSADDSRETLMRKLNCAIAEERFEDAAKIRDLLKSISPKA